MFVLKEKRTLIVPTTANSYFENLINKKECITHFENQEVHNDKNYVNARGVLESTDCFNLGSLRMKTQDIELMDPQLKMLLDLSCELKENYKNFGQDIPQNTGVYIQEYPLLLHGNNLN